MQSISYRQVDFSDGFWKNRQDINRKITMPAMEARFRETGRFDALRLHWEEGMPKPHIFWDSDIAKWAQTAAYLLGKEPNAQLERAVEQVIDLIEQGQDEHGYFNCYFSVFEPEARFTRRTEHELYCAGHLIEAAIAYYEATGKDRFMRLMCKFADYIEQVFVHEQSAAFVTPGHEEIELALVALYRATGEERYLSLARFFIDQRGNNEKDTPGYGFSNMRYNQSHLPVREQTTAEGHSVRAGYLYCAMADLARECKDEALLAACRTLFNNIVNRRMYITGGIGQSHIGEAFTIDYDLPNLTAYAETCAAISLAFFAQRMLACEADSAYGDIVERTLYNGILSGVSLSGEEFFYENPLRIERALIERDISVEPQHRGRLPIIERQRVFSCSCCPPNLTRLIASLGEYVYGRDGDTYYIHQYIAGTMRDGDAHITQHTRYPADGHITIKTRGVSRLAVRIPGWCRSFTVNAPYTLSRGYAYLSPAGGDIELTFAMEPTLWMASPKVGENAGRAALQCGPLVYCLEEADNGADLAALCVGRRLNAQLSFDPAYGANVITADGYRPTPVDALYTPLQDTMQSVRLRFIPYFAFANRGPSDMLVWVGVR